MLARNSRLVSRTIAPAVLTIALISLASCVTQGESGGKASVDQHVYVSYPWEPKTVSLIDTRTDEVIWSFEIPVGEKLVIRFENHRRRLSGQTMTWGSGDPDEGKIKLVNEMPVPSYQVRKLSWTIRPIPEFASSDDDDASGG